MRKLVFLLFLFFLIPGIYAQDGFYVKILDEDGVPESSMLKTDSTVELKFKDSELENTLKKYSITSFKRVFQKSKNPYLQNVYRVITKDLTIINELREKYSDIYTRIELWDKPVPLYEPNDYAYELSDQKGLDLIRAKEAWDITHGSSDIIVGINDTYIETDHEDLEDKIEGVLANSSPHYHGVAVSFCAGGDTDNGKGLSSIGFETKIMFKSGLDIDHLYDLADEGCDIVNASYRNCIWNSTEAAVIEDIHDLGVIIVAAAGNGPDGTSCGGGHGYCYPASYPHVISVTAVSHLFPYGYNHPVYGDYAWEDCHEDSINHPTRVYTHNDKVDLCAPAYHVHTATLNDSYTAAWGTSFASPIVAGLCALVLAENPGLDPDEVETILKSTAFDLTTIPENEEFSGLLGDGRINAYAAVNAARETNVTYSSVPYSTGFESGLDENWTMYESHRYGRSVLNTDHSPHTGSYHITMDVLNNGYYNTNEAWLHLNLSGESDVILQFWWKDTGDESHSSDGIYISDDGGDNFTKIYNLTNGSSTYSKVSIDLSNEIDDAELDHSSTFVVKFQQYDNYTIPTDGIAIDDVQLCVPLSEPSYISGPYEHCIFEWEEYTCTSVPGAVDYDWNFTGKYLSGSGTTVEVMDTHDGWYTLSVRAENACGQYSDWKNKSIYIDDCMGKMMENPPIFWIIPNPADSQVEIVIDQEKFKDSGYSDGTEYRILIIDIKGVIVYDTKTIDTNNKIDISRFPNGNYTVQLIIDEDVFSQILIVEH